MIFKSKIREPVRVQESYYFRNLLLKRFNHLFSAFTIYVVYGFEATSFLRKSIIQQGNFAKNSLLTATSI